MPIFLLKRTGKFFVPNFIPLPATATTISFALLYLFHIQAERIPTRQELALLAQIFQVSQTA